MLSIGEVNVTNITKKHLKDALKKKGVLAKAGNVFVQELPRNKTRNQDSTVLRFKVWQGDTCLFIVCCGDYAAFELKKFKKYGQKFSDYGPELVASFSLQKVPVVVWRYIEGVDLKTSFEKGLLDLDQVIEIVQGLQQELDVCSRKSSQEKFGTEVDRFIEDIDTIGVLGSGDKECIKEICYPILSSSIGFQQNKIRITNGDFTPFNILVQPDGTPRIIDFEFSDETHFFKEDYVRFNYFMGKGERERLFSVFENEEELKYYEFFFNVKQILMEAKVSSEKLFRKHFMAKMKRLLIYHDDLGISNDSLLLRKVRESNESITAFNDGFVSQVFWSKRNEFEESKSNTKVLKLSEWQKLKFEISDTQNINHLRIDPVNAIGLIFVDDIQIRLHDDENNTTLDPGWVLDNIHVGGTAVKLPDRTLCMFSFGKDPQLHLSWENIYFGKNLDLSISLKVDNRIESLSPFYRQSIGSQPGANMGLLNPERPPKISSEESLPAVKESEPESTRKIGVICQLFWSTGNSFSEKNSIRKDILTDEKEQSVSFAVTSKEVIQRLRLDPASLPAEIDVLGISLFNTAGKELLSFNKENLLDEVSIGGDLKYNIEDKLLYSLGKDPYFEFLDIEGYQLNELRLEYRFVCRFSIKKMVNDHEEQIRDYERGLKILWSKLGAKNDGANNKNSGFVEAIEDCVSKLSENEKANADTINDLIKDKLQLAEECELRLREKGELEKRVGESEDSIRGLEEKIQGLEKDSEALQGTLLQTKSDLEETIEKLNSESQLNRENESKVSDLRDEVDLLQKHKVDLESQLEEKVVERDLLLKSVETKEVELSKVETEKDSMKELLSSLRSEKRKLNMRFSYQLSKNEKLISKNQEIDSEIKRLLENEQSLTKSLSDLNKELELERSKLETKLTECDHLNKELAMERTALNAKRAEYQQLIKELDMERVKLDLKRVQKTQLEKELDLLIQDKNSVSEILREKEDQILEISRVRNACQAAVSSNEDIIEKYLGLLEQKDRELINNRREISIMGMRYEDILAEREELRKRVSELEQGLGNRILSWVKKD